MIMKFQEQVFALTYVQYKMFSKGEDNDVKQAGNMKRAISHLIFLPSVSKSIISITST